MAQPPHLELERTATVAARVELVAVGQRADVVHAHGVARLGEVGAITENNASGGSARLIFFQTTNTWVHSNSPAIHSPWLDGIDLERHASFVGLEEGVAAVVREDWHLSRPWIQNPRHSTVKGLSRTLPNSLAIP